MSGRPRALDNVKCREVCALIAAGCGIEAAAHYVGCTSITIRREAMRNPDFYERLRNAELAAQISPLQAIRKAADTHWRAAAWFLERTKPQEFGRRAPDTISPNDVKIFCEDIVQIVFEEMPQEDAIMRIEKRMMSLLAELERRDFAARSPRPDVRSQRKQREEDQNVVRRAALRQSDSRTDALGPDQAAASAPPAMDRPPQSTDSIQQNSEPFCSP